MIIRQIFKLVLFFIFFCSCGGTEKRLLPYENFSFPIDLVYDEENSNLFVVSSNFDLGFKYGNVKGISIERLKPLLLNPCKNECVDYNKSTIIDNGVSIGDYAGISIYDKNKIFTPLRKDDRIAVIEVNKTGSLFCGSGEKIIGDCDDMHLISTDYTEPFAMASDKSNCIYVSFLKSGSVICVDKNNYKSSQDLFADFSNGYEFGGVRDIDISDNSLLISAYGYLMNGRNLLPLSYEFLGKRYTVFLDFTDQIGSAFQESVKISRQNKRFFISLREPDLLLSIDYEIYKDGTFILTDYRMLSLYRYPSRLYIEFARSSSRELLFASLIDEDRIFVYDTSNMILLSEINEGLDGPYGMKMINIDGIDYLFVANFESAVISVYKFVSKDSKFEYILSIGKPRAKEKGEY